MLPSYTFDTPVTSLNLSVFPPGPPAFNVFNAGALQTGALSVITKTATVVEAQFPALVVQQAVGASVGLKAVTGGGKTNADDERPLQTIVFQAGQTAGSDLLSVTVGKNAAGATTVTFAFDAPPGSPPDHSNADFHLYDANGNQLKSSAGGVNGGPAFLDPTKVVFTGFSASAIAAGVVAGAQDGQAGGGPGFVVNQPRFTEGCVPFHA